MQSISRILTVILVAVSFFIGTPATAQTYESTKFGLVITTPSDRWTISGDGSATDWWYVASVKDKRDQAGGNISAWYAVDAKKFLRTVKDKYKFGDWTSDATVKDWAEKFLFEERFMNGPYAAGKGPWPIQNTSSFDKQIGGVTFHCVRTDYLLSGNNRSTLHCHGEGKVEGKVVWYVVILANTSLYHQLSESSEPVEKILQGIQVHINK